MFLITTDLPASIIPYQAAFVPLESSGCVFAVTANFMKMLVLVRKVLLKVFIDSHPFNWPQSSFFLSFHSYSHILSHQQATFLLFSADSSLLISDFEPQQASAEAGTEDEFDPIPVTGRKNSQGKPLRSP